MKIGIVGTGFIADVVARAIAESESVALVGVASRRAETARAFAQRHSEPTVFEHWSDLLASPGVDAVYVATPTAVREAICVAAASEGKHVLAEKPFVDLGSLRTITEACRQNGVAFMDATHFTHHPRTQLLRRELESRIGRVRSINSCFYFPNTDRGNIRYNPALEPTGAFGDMAWYAMRAVAEYGAPDVQLVHAAAAAQRDAQSGAIIRAAGVLQFDDGSTSTFDAGYDAGSCIMDLALIGTRGMITLDDFVLDWAGGLAPGIPNYPVGFVQRVGVVAPGGFSRVDVHSDTRQVVCMLHDFADLTREPSGANTAECIRLSERTQSLLDAVWQRMVTA